MSYLTVDKQNREELHSRKPERYDFNAVEAPYIINYSGWKSAGRKIRLPNGTIKILLGRKMSWKNEPVMLKEIRNEKRTERKDL